MAKLDSDPARQGRKGTPILLILIVALVLCVILFLGFGATGWFESDPNLSNANKAEEVQAPPAAGSAPGDSTVVSPSAPEQPTSPQ